MLTGCGRVQNSSPAINQGDWVSSGGERLKDSLNPWWLKNVKDVDYCIEIDEASISAKRGDIETVVAQALAYWKDELHRTTSLLEDPFGMLKNWNAVGVGAQNFHYVACSGLEDLKFKFGLPTLSPSELIYLKDPLRFVAVAVRTHYDEKLLRGKGFIFVGSDVGPHRFGPDTQAENAWSFKSLLQLAMIHEVGHLFGIAHVGNRFSIMGAAILEQVTRKDWATVFGNHAMHDSEIPKFFVPKKEWHGCSQGEQNETWPSFFEFSQKKKCLQFQFNEEEKTFSIGAYNSGEKERISVGKFDSLKLKMNSWPTNGVLIYLNPLQTIFDFPAQDAPKEAPKFTFLPGPFFVSGEGGVKFQSEKGLTKPLHVAVGPEQFTLSGEWQGSHITLIDWSSRAY